MRSQQLSLGLKTERPEVSDEMIRAAHSRLSFGVPLDEVLRVPYLRECLGRVALLHQAKDQRIHRRAR